MPPLLAPGSNGPTASPGARLGGLETRRTIPPLSARYCGIYYSGPLVPQAGRRLHDAGIRAAQRRGRRVRRWNRPAPSDRRCGRRGATGRLREILRSLRARPAPLGDRACALRGRVRSVDAGYRVRSGHGGGEVRKRGVMLVSNIRKDGVPVRLPARRRNAVSFRRSASRRSLRRDLASRHQDTVARRRYPVREPRGRLGRARRRHEGPPGRTARPACLRLRRHFPRRSRRRERRQQLVGDSRSCQNPSGHRAASRCT